MKRSIYLEVALKAVRQAEAVIMKYYGKKSVARLKSDQSPVTFADMEAEDIISQIILEVFPDHNFLGEERGEKGLESEYLWIIDPIDGTKNYIRQIPLFATQIALMKNKELVLGISNAPALNELIYAEKGKGAYCNNSRIYVSKNRDLGDAYLSYGNIRHFENIKRVPQLLHLINSVRNPRGFGDAWSYHLLAQGKIDIMIDAKTKIWDIAAISVIVREAGGEVTNFHGDSITSEDNFSTSLLATNSILHKDVLEILDSQKIN